MGKRIYRPAQVGPVASGPKYAAMLGSPAEENMILDEGAIANYERQQAKREHLASMGLSPADIEQYMLEDAERMQLVPDYGMHASLLDTAKSALKDQAEADHDIWKDYGKKPLTIEDEIEKAAAAEQPTQSPPIKSYPPPQNPRSPATPRRQTAAPKDIYQQDTIPPPLVVATPEDEAAILGYPTIDPPTPESVGWKDIGLPDGEDPSLGMFGPELPPGYGETPADPMQTRREAYDQMLEEINNMELQALRGQQEGIDELEHYQGQINNLPVQTNLMPLMALHESLFNDPSLAKHYNEPMSAAEHLQANLNFAPKVQEARENKTLRELDFKKAKIAARKALLDAEEQMLLKQAELASLEARKGMELDSAAALQEDKQAHDIEFQGVKDVGLEKRARIIAAGQAARDKNKSPGWDATDRDYAPTYIEDVVKNGLGRAKTEIASMKNLISKMRKSGSKISGKDVGMARGIKVLGIGDGLGNLFYEDSVRMQEDVESKVVKTIRETLGSQFTEGENLAVLKRTFNVNLSPEVNAQRLEFVLKQAEIGLQGKMAAAAWFKDRGTLEGFQGVDNSKLMAEMEAYFDQTDSGAAPSKPSKKKPSITLDPAMREKLQKGRK